MFCKKELFFARLRTPRLYVYKSTYQPEAKSSYCSQRGPNLFPAPKFKSSELPVIPDLGADAFGL